MMVCQPSSFKTIHIYHTYFEQLLCQVFLQQASLRTKMHCYLQKVELISHWTEAGSQRIIQCKSRYNYFQAVFWVLGLTKPLRVICYHTPLRNLWSKNILLAKCLAKSPHILHLPSQTYKMCYCTSRHTKKNLSCSQEMAARCRLSSEKTAHIQPILVFCYGTVPGKKKRCKQAELPVVLLSKVIYLLHAILHMCTRCDSTAGKNCSIWPFPPITVTSPAGGAGYHCQSKRQNSCGNSAAKMFVNVKPWFPQP